MRRFLVLLLLFAAVWSAGAGEAFAQAATSPDWRGPGQYLSWIKIAFYFAMVVLWVHSTDWVSRDGRQYDLNYLRWNPIVFGVFMGAAVIGWLIPTFWVSYPLMIVAWVVPLTLYVLYRNGQVEDHQKVFTKDHLRFWAAQQLGKLGIKVQAEAVDASEAGVPVVLNARGGGPSERDETQRTYQIKQHPGLFPAREVLADGITRRADAIMLDFSQTGVSVRHLIDGVWHNGEPIEREEADPALEALKALCGLNPADRQSRQEGKFGIDYFILKPQVFQRMEKAKAALREKLSKEYTRTFGKEMAKALIEQTPQGMPVPEVNTAELELRVRAAVEEQVRLKFADAVGPHTPIDKLEVGKVPFTDRPNPATSLEPVKATGALSTAGTPTGERVLIQVEGKKARFPSLDAIGMRPKMQEQLKDLLRLDRGMVLISAMPAQGLRSTMTVVLRAADRFTREFVAVEDKGNRYEEIENVPVTLYETAAGPTSVLPDLFHHEPRVVVIRDLVNAETVGLLLSEVPKDRLFISTMRAVDSVDAIYRVLAMKVPPSDLAPAVVAVMNQRLLRKLCEHCKEPYAPPPQTLAQLGIPGDRVQAFYRPHQPTEQEEPCPVCSGIGYLGRTAFFELLVVDDTVRKAIASGAKPDLVRQVARKAGFRSLQEEGILLVAKGTTSLQELIRVMKSEK